MTNAIEVHYIMGLSCAWYDGGARGVDSRPLGASLASIWDVFGD